MITATKLLKDFPLLAAHPDLVYLDTAATSQKPARVIEALRRYYLESNANVHRGAYTLSIQATEAYESARAELARFINASRPEEIIFTRNTTEAMNLVAYAWGLRNLKADDVVLVTEMEHHASLVPWHLIKEHLGFEIKAVPITEEGRLDLVAFRELLDERVKLVSVVHMSNVLGTVNPVREIVAEARAKGAITVVDAAQSAPHMPIDVQAIGADFVAMSGHKMMGPTGIGALFGRFELLSSLKPFLGGGEMIDEVFIDRSTYAAPPQRFEAGTPAIGEAVALGEAVRYLDELGMEAVWQHDRELVDYALELLAEIPEVRVFGPKGEDRGGVVSFTLGSLHAHDVASALNEQGIAVRAGHHCAQPLHRRLGVSSTARASFYVYNTKRDVERFAQALTHTRDFFKDWL